MAKASFDHLVDPAHKGKSAADLLDLGVDAIKGLSAGDRQKLESALGASTVRQVASNRLLAVARAIHEDAEDLGHDRGPDPEWTAFLASAPLATYQAHPTEFRLDFGPIYYRGRLDGTARVLVVGQDPAANELVGHRAFVGASGQRIQGFLRRIGIRRDYILVNTYLYPVFGQFIGTLRDLSHDSSIQGFRNQLLDRIAEQNPLEAVIAVGAAARDAVERWPGSGGLLVQHIMHPSAQDSAALLATWNAALGVLRPAVEPEAGAARDDATYGTEFLPVDHEPVPRRDLPFGMPEWHGVGSHADRARLADGSTDHKRIIWTAT